MHRLARPSLLACAILINQECHYNILLVIEYMAINDNYYFFTKHGHTGDIQCIFDNLHMAKITHLNEC